jgi:hypothetical protein
MTVSMGIKHRGSGDYEVVPVATNRTFREVWLPACKGLGLSLVPLFFGGAFLHVPPNLVPGIVSELERLREWASSREDGAYLVDRCGDILAAFARTDPGACDYDFG